MFGRVFALTVAIAAFHSGVAHAQARVSAWLDAPTPTSWNTPGRSLPTSPTVDGNLDPRCRAQARPPQSNEDKRLRAAGWDLVGAYQGGWQTLVIRATAAYDGMCRPRRIRTSFSCAAGSRGLSRPNRWRAERMARSFACSFRAPVS
jgi:hypothetical protein